MLWIIGVLFTIVAIYYVIKKNYATAFICVLCIMLTIFVIFVSIETTVSENVISTTKTCYAQIIQKEALGIYKTIDGTFIEIDEELIEEKINSYNPHIDKYEEKIQYSELGRILLFVKEKSKLSYIVYLPE